MVIGIKNKEDFEEELKARFPNSNVEILTYTRASGPISYRCLDCGKIYSKTRANHLYENKTLCSYCFSGKTSKVRDLVYNKIAKDFEIIEWNGNTGVAITFKCLSCGYIFQRHPGNIKEDYDKSTFCPQCGINGSLVSQDIYQYRMKQKGLDGYKIITYKNYTSSMKLQHSCGYVFSVLPHNFLKSRGCPKCFGKISKGEHKIYQFLEENGINFEYQKKFTQLGHKSFDFFIPSHNLLIEYQGEQHYTPVPGWGGQEKFEQQQENDNIKREFAREYNYNLLEISYRDFANIEQILSFLKGSTTTSVGPSGSKKELK